MINVRTAQPTDNAELCSLCEHAMQGSIGIAMERNPNFFVGSNVQCENSEVFVVYNDHNNEILGVFSIGTRRVWLDGKINNIRYFSDLRLKNGSQRAQSLFAMCNFIATSGFLEGTLAQTVVFDENTGMNKVIDLLNRRALKHNIFQYYQHGSFVSHMVHVSSKPVRVKNKYNIERANSKNINELQTFLEQEGPHHPFFPYFNFNELNNAYNCGLQIENFYIAREQGNIVGIMAYWNQSEYKQTRIKSYARAIQIARPFVNVFARIFGGFSLPKVGETMNYASLHSILVKNDNSDVFAALTNAILSDLKQLPYQYLLCGLPNIHPFQDTLSGFNKRRTIKGNCYLVSNQPPAALSNPNFYLELGRI